MAGEKHAIAASFLWRHYRCWAFAAWLAVVGVMLGLLGSIRLGDGFLFDASVALRSRLHGQQIPAPAALPVVVVGLDEKTLAAAEFESLPRTFLAPRWAELLELLFSSGVRQVGFDIIFNYSANSYETDYDQAFLRALRLHKDQVVLARSVDLAPAPPYFHALGAAGLALADLPISSDGVLRSVRLAYVPRNGGAPLASIAGALWSRSQPGTVQLPVTDRLLAPFYHPYGIPHYSVIDVLRQKNNPDALRQAFAGKIVLVAATLLEEDINLTSARFISTPASAPAASSTALAPSIPQNNRNNIAGVFVHAMALDALLSPERHSALVTPVPAWAHHAVVLLWAGLASLACLWLAPISALAIAVLLSLLLLTTSTMLLEAGYWLSPGFALATIWVSLSGHHLLRLVAGERIVREHQRSLEHLTHHAQTLAAANEQLEHLALTDPLTGLPNRRHAMQSLAQIFAQSQQEDSPLTVMMLDADGFKQINDRYGHDAGDNVLVVLARTLRHAMRSDDIVCRLGGDEFFIICPRTPLHQALRVAESMRRQVAALRVAAGDGEWCGSVSVGVAERAQLPDIESLMKAADEGVYAAKRGGRNRVETIQDYGG